jgi:Phosphotransferase enzyme family
MTSLMTETLEEGLTRLWDRPVRIRDLRRRRLSSSSSFETERLRVALEGGTVLSVFFKNLHPERLSATARAVRTFDLEPSFRELQMYRTVLAPERFGTLHLYAHRWDRATETYWLFLEDGGRVLLHDFLYMPRWIAAAQWAARFHAATGDLPAERTSFLPCYDEAHYRRAAERVAGILPHLAGRERELVERGLARYVEHIEALCALPRCVVHGQYFGKNILFRRQKGGSRIIVIDWETAALGPGAFDLVSLTSGKWTRKQRDEMRKAYFDAYQSETGRSLEWEPFCEELAAVALYQALEWLAWWGHHRNLSRHFGNFLKELAALLDERAVAA